MCTLRTVILMDNQRHRGDILAAYDIVRPTLWYISAISLVNGPNVELFLSTVAFERKQMEKMPAASVLIQFKHRPSNFIWPILKGTSRY